MNRFAERGGFGRRVSACCTSGPRLRLVLLLLGAVGMVCWSRTSVRSSRCSSRSVYHFGYDAVGPRSAPRHVAKRHELPSCFTTDVYRTVAFRTVGATLAVTVICLVIALPVAFYMARIASQALRPAVVSGDDAALGRLPGQGLRVAVDARPLGWCTARSVRPFAGLRASGAVINAFVSLVAVHGRSPSTSGSNACRLVARSVDRSRRQGGPHVREGGVAELRPSIVAGSIFTFALTLGDFYMVQIVGGSTQFLGNIVYREFSANLPFRGGVRRRSRSWIMFMYLSWHVCRRARGALAVYVSRPARYRARGVHGAGAGRSCTSRSCTSPGFVQQTELGFAGRRRASRRTGGTPRQRDRSARGPGSFDRNRRARVAPLPSCSARSLHSRRRVIVSSVETPSASCSCCRSRCPASSPVSRSTAGYHRAGIALSLFTLVVAHATFCIVIVFNNVRGPIASALTEPGRGVRRPRRRHVPDLRYITFPLIESAMLAGALLAFALSFDEIVVTTFTAGSGFETLPLWIFNNMFRPNNLPLVNVVATVSWCSRSSPCISRNA